VKAKLWLWLLLHCRHVTYQALGVHLSQPLLPPGLSQPGSSPDSVTICAAGELEDEQPKHISPVFTTNLCLSVTESLLPEVKVLQKIRLLSLIGRGMQFLEQEKHKEALLDFQHGLQISPGKRLILMRNREFSLFFFYCTALMISAERCHDLGHAYSNVKGY